jgi:hypothetical protein
MIKGACSFIWASLDGDEKLCLKMNRFTAHQLTAGAGDTIRA